MLASVVAAVFGILAASLSNGVNTVNYTLLVVPALAGALWGVAPLVTAEPASIRNGSVELSLQIKSWW